MAGAGSQRAGVSSAGWGTCTAVATGLGGVFLRDEQDRGLSHAARRIDPVKGDYVMDEYGRLLGMSYVRQCVLLSVSTERGSAAVQEMGQNLRSIKKITPNVEREILGVLIEAVMPLIRQGLIQVVGFTAFRAGDGTNGLRRGAVYGKFLWRDLTDGQEHEEIV